MIKKLFILLLCQFTYGQVVIDSYRFESGLTNLWQDTAAEGDSDTNATTGWTTSQATVTSVSTPTAKDGTYSIDISNTNTNGDDRGIVTISGLNASSSYTFTYWAKTDGASDDTAVQVLADQLDGVQYLQPITDTTTWTEYSTTLDPLGTSVEFRFHADKTTGGDTGDHLYIDLVTLTED